MQGTFRYSKNSSWEYHNTRTHACHTPSKTDNPSPGSRCAVVITNAYLIYKNDDLRKTAIKKECMNLLIFPDQLSLIRFIPTIGIRRSASFQ